MTRRRIPEPQYIDTDTYRIRWEGAPDPDTGKRRQHSRTVHGSLQDAQRALMDELLRAGRSDEVDLTGALTLRDYWEREYSRDIQRLAPKTVDDYTSDWERLVGPLFGEVDMRSASRRAIRRMLLDVQPPGRQRHAYKLLRQMFNAAYFDELIDENPMQGRMKLDKVPKREPEAYTLLWAQMGGFPLRGGGHHQRKEGGRLRARRAHGAAHKGEGRGRCHEDGAEHAHRRGDGLRGSTLERVPLGARRMAQRAFR